MTESTNTTTNTANDKMKEEILLSKRMFIAGCFGLPWLWICNVLYFRLRVFNPIVLIDYWPGKSPPTTTIANDTNVNESRREGDEQLRLEQQLQQQMHLEELKTWVKRSTRGALLVVSLFITWVIVFQVNKDSFSQKWFVMDQTAYEITGW